MPWTIERKHPHVAVVTMNTNKVNAQNPAFFADLHAAFDRLESEFADCAVVLTGSGAVFTAGLDFDHHFPMFARRSIKEIDAWFEEYRATNLRLFTYPRPTVAAINGHAYAGGFITAIDCDHRIASEGPLQFALNEVPIGIPMPAVYCEIIKHAIGPRSAFELTLFGQITSPPPNIWASSSRRSRRTSCSRRPSHGRRWCHRIATRPTLSRSARFRRPPWRLSTPPLASTETCCRAACRISEASVPTRDATRN
jgi:Enoyl-CoA hydratase/isomerase